MNKKLVGVLGVTGRVGKLLSSAIRNNSSFNLSLSYSRDPQSPLNTNDLYEVFKNNDYIIDFSSSAIIQDILEACIKHPKPLILCTTGWDTNNFQEALTALSKIVPIVIAPNTSIGTALQLYFSGVAAKILGEDYSITINEIHHIHKKDSPSGTAKALAQKVGLDYSLIQSSRIGENPGEHEITFYNKDDMISIKHITFNRELFAKGAVKIIELLETQKMKPGIYSVLDIFKINPR